jgi:hypothetical protein
MIWRSRRPVPHRSPRDQLAFSIGFAVARSRRSAAAHPEGPHHCTPDARRTGAEHLEQLDEADQVLRSARRPPATASGRWQGYGRAGRGERCRRRLLQEHTVGRVARTVGPGLIVVAIAHASRMDGGQAAAVASSGRSPAPRRRAPARCARLARSSVHNLAGAAGGRARRKYSLRGGVCGRSYRRVGAPTMVARGGAWCPRRVVPLHQR